MSVAGHSKSERCVDDVTSGVPIGSCFVREVPEFGGVIIPKNSSEPRPSPNRWESAMGTNSQLADSRQVFVQAPVWICLLYIIRPKPVRVRGRSAGQDRLDHGQAVGRGSQVMSRGSQAQAMRVADPGSVLGPGS